MGKQLKDKLFVRFKKRWLGKSRSNAAFRLRIRLAR